MTLPLEGIGSDDKSKIACQFTNGSLDLVVTDFGGKNYRLLNDNLEHDIVPENSKYVIKPNKLVLKLGKVKGEYSYDSWTQLTAKKKKKRDATGKTVKDTDNPMAGIMDLMKDMYLRQRRRQHEEDDRRDDDEAAHGQLGKDGDMGMPGMGDMGMGGFGM